MQLREALDQIAEIRLRMAESEVFRGYRAIPAAISGFLAALGGMVQLWLLPEPVQNIGLYLLIWGLVASVSFVAALMTMWTRDWLIGSSRTRMFTWIVLWQLVPPLLAGVILTIVIIRDSLETIWILPGLWQIFYSLGLFASCRYLPRAVYAIATFYFLSGIFCLCFARGENGLSPLSMALPFGVGQFAAAAILYWTLERHESRQTTSEFLGTGAFRFR